MFAVTIQVFDRTVASGEGSVLSEANMADAKQEQLWVLRAQVGSRDALDALFRAVQTPLFRYLTGLLGDRVLAEDVLQEVLLRIYQKIAWLREPALFRPWCFRIATREAFKRLPRERRWSAHIRDPVLLDAVAAPEESPKPEILARLPEL